MDLDLRISQEKIDINGELFTFDQLTGIGPDTSREFRVQPNRYAYIAALCGKAEAEYNRAKHLRETMYADLELDYREKLPDEGVKVTDAVVKAYAQTDKRYAAAVGKEHDSLETWKVLKGLESALRERGQALISLDANARREYNMITSVAQAKQQLQDMRE